MENNDNLISLVRPNDGVRLYFDKDSIKSTELVGRTQEQLPVYQITYNDESTETFIDLYRELEEK